MPGGSPWIDATRYTVVQRFFLMRLEHLIALRRLPSLVVEPRQARLINHAIYSTYRDCTTLGLLAEARTVLRGEEGAPQSSTSSCE